MIVSRSILDFFTVIRVQFHLSLHWICRLKNNAKYCLNNNDKFEWQISGFIDVYNICFPQCLCPDEKYTDRECKWQAILDPHVIIWFLTLSAISGTITKNLILFTNIITSSVLYHWNGLDGKDTRAFNSILSFAYLHNSNRLAWM